MEPRYIIYKITNKVNGKVYIGQSSKTVEERFDMHANYAKRGANLHFSRAIRKYGRDAFILETLLSNLSKDEANFYEQYFIKKYDSTNVGYNMTPGGDGGNTYLKRTEQQMIETKKKIGIANKGGKNGNAHSIRMLNVISNEITIFGSNIECVQYLKSIGINIQERLVLGRIHFAEKYGVQPVIGEKYIFASNNEPFSRYSFFQPIGGGHPYKVTCKKTNEEYYAVSSKDAMNHFNMSKSAFERNIKTQKDYIIERLGNE